MQYLDKSDTRLKLALQVTNTGMWEWNILTGQVVWSENFEPLFGLDPGTLEGKYRGLLKRIVQLDRRAVTQAIARAIAKRANYNIKFRVYRSDGSIRWLASQGEVYCDECSHPVKMLGLCWDITLDKQAETSRYRYEVPNLGLNDLTPDAMALRLALTEHQALGATQSIAQWNLGQRNMAESCAGKMTQSKHSRSTLSLSEPLPQSILNSLEDVVWSASVDTFELLYLNPAAEKIYGRPSPDFFENPKLWLEAIHPEDRDRVWVERHNIFETGSYDLEYRIVRPTGEIRWLRDRTRLILDANGNPIRLDGIATDITQRSSRFTALQQANEALEVRVQERTTALEQVVEQLRSEITERKLSQQAQERLTAILEETTDAVGIMDAAGRPLYLNRAARLMLGIAEAQDLSIVRLGACSTLWMKALIRGEGVSTAIREGVWSGETTLPHHKGKEIPVSLVIMCHKSESGEVEFISIIARNIIQAKQAEAALARSEAKWRSLIQNSSDLITILSEDGTILYESPSIERILGYSPEELVGQPILKYIFPEDKKAIRKAMRKLLVAGDSVTLPPMVLRFRCKDGSWCFLEASGTNLLADEAVGGIVINSRNVTDRFKVQEALRQSEVRFRAIFEGAALGIALSDPTGVLLTTNPALQKMLGYSEQELRHRAITHPDDVAADSHLYQALLAGSLPSYQMEKRYFHKDGHLVWGRLTVSLVRDKAGSPLFVVAMVEDITAAKQTQAALLRISKAVENASDAISITDTLGSKLIYLNPAFCQMFEYTLGQLNATGGAAILFSDPKTMHEVFAIAVSGHSWQGEVEMRSRSGVNKQIALRTDAIKDVTGEVVGTIAIHTDITERKQAEADLRRSYHRAELLKQITTEIRSSLDLQHIFQTTVTQLGQALQVNRCMIHLYQEAPEPRLPIVAEYLEPGYSSMQHLELPVKENPHIEVVLAVDQAIACVNVYAEPLLEAAVYLCQTMGIKSMVSIRTSYQGKPNGVLCLHQCDYYRNWESSDIELLEAVAAQVGIALTQAHLLEKEKHTAAQLAQQNLALQLSEARERAKATELEQALRELQQTQFQLVQTEKMSSLGQLVAGVAHEINNPVGFITGNISYACDYIQDLLSVLNLYQQHYPQPAEAIQVEIEEIDLDFLIKDLPKLLQSMKVGAERINQIVVSLRNFSRNDEAEMKLVDIHEGIDSTLMILQNCLKAKGSSCEIQVIKEYGTLPLVECYAGQLNQVFMNLISNAIDALEERRSKTVTRSPKRSRSDAHIQICTEVQGDNKVVIRIADNGAGMTQEVQQKLFNPFFTTKPMGKGTGLGLSISYQIVVERHCGKLQCFSVPGEGTEFIIEIPIRHLHEKTA
jgi:PAS domain S-box-containing protein